MSFIKNWLVLFVLSLFCASLLSAQQNRLLVVSIDGLDHRWLRDAGKLGMKIPNLRRLISEGARADGVVGIVPTVTWPSHTTMITGVRAWEHGITSNDQPGQPGQRWWYAKFLKTKTLWHRARENGLKTGAVWWPVTAEADIDFNFPEFWDDAARKPRAFAPVARHATPGLVERIRRTHPSFGRTSFDDSNKVLAARWIIESERPELFLLHLGELDSAQHETGAFSETAKTTLEHQDELLGELLSVLPERTFVAIVSDHGFETQRRVLRPAFLLRQAGIEASVEVAQGLFGVTDERAAAYFRSAAGKPVTAIAREVPMDDVRRLAPSLRHWSAAFETAFEILPVSGKDGPALGDGNGRGYHGLWPMRAECRAAFLLWGPGVKARVLPEISMLDLAPTFADILGLKLPQARGKSRWNSLR